MEAIKYIFNDDGDMIKTFVNLPSDLMVIYSGSENLCHSKTDGKYYIINSSDNILVFSGSWLDCVKCYADSPLSREFLPFEIGKPIDSIKVKGCSYLPFFEYENTGEKDEEGFDIFKENYKILHIHSYNHVTLVDDIRFTNRTKQFEVESFGEDLTDMVEALQIYTGIIF